MGLGKTVGAVREENTHTQKGTEQFSGGQVKVGIKPLSREGAKDLLTSLNLHVLCKKQ